MKFVDNDNYDDNEKKDNINKLKFLDYNRLNRL